MLDSSTKFKKTVLSYSPDTPYDAAGRHHRWAPVGAVSSVDIEVREPREFGTNPDFLCSTATVHAGRLVDRTMGGVA